MNKLLGARIVVLLIAGPSAALAQTADVIRGRVVGIDDTPLANVTVVASTARGGQSRTSRTQSDGRYTITFPSAEGHYFLSFTALGFAPRQLEVRRLADEEILIANAKLHMAAAILDSVDVIGGRLRVARGDMLEPDISGTEQSAVLSGASQQDLTAIAGFAGSIPGATTIFGLDGDPSGFSVLGLPVDQNAITLNGAGFSGSSLPRDASITATLATNPYDVTKGGFSGAQLNLQRTPGSNFKRRSTSLLANPEFLQYRTASPEALAQKYSSLSLGGIASGPIVYDKAYYDISLEAGRRSSDLRNLLNAGRSDLLAAGIEPDSVVELIARLGDKGVPLIPTARPSLDRVIGTVRVFGTLDFAPANAGTSQTINLNFFGSSTRLTPAGQSLAEVPAHNGDRTDQDFGAQVTHSAYLRNIVLSETTVDFAEKESRAEPYLRLPSAHVLLTSKFADGTSTTRGLEFGGSPSLSSHSNNSAFGARNQLSWFSDDNNHRVKLLTEIRKTANLFDPSRNVFGTFVYASLADLRSDRPSSFSRSLLLRSTEASETTFAIALGDAYRRTPNLQIQYGVRVDANRLGNAPAFNQEVYNAFGLRNDDVPSRIYLSPRIGFAWTYGGKGTGGGAVRGGAGIFQNVSASSLLSRAIDRSGLRDGEAQVYCIGASVPRPDWNAFVANSHTIPDRCENGTQSSPFTSTEPNILVIGPGFSASRSLRGNLQWNGRVFSDRYSTTVDGLYSRNLNQPSFVDVNFEARPRFTLTDEIRRPVYVEPTSIVQETGAVSSRDARLFPQFNQVLEYRSDLVSESRQVRFTMSPVRSSSTFRWLASYLLSYNREQFRGFTSSAASPHGVDWSPSEFDSRHQLTVNLESNFLSAIRIDAFVRLASGVGFTPMTGDDINGDGIVNDRAFVLNPDVSPDTILARDMRRLLDNSPTFVRNCLVKHLGGVASRNSCRTPWASNANLAFTLNPTKIGLSQRFGLSFVVGNPIGALDHVLHGSGGLRGWGQPTVPDQTLLFVRGFNAATKQFKYDLNWRFGRTNPQFAARRQPISLSVSLRVDFGPSREQQSLILQLEKGRRLEGPRLTPSLLRDMYASAGVMNPIAVLLRDAESLELTGQQADSLAVMNVRYTASQDSIWTRAAQNLADLPVRFDHSSAYREYRRAREATIDHLIALVPMVREILTAAQKQKLSPAVVLYLDRKYLLDVRSGVTGDSGAGIFSRSPGGLGGAGGTVVNRTDIINRFR